MTSLTATQKIELYEAKSAYDCAENQTLRGLSSQGVNAHLDHVSSLFKTYTALLDAHGLDVLEGGKLCNEIWRNLDALCAAAEAEGWVPYYKRKKAIDPLAATPDGLVG